MVVLKLKKKKTSIPNLLPFSEMTSGWNRYSVKNNTQFVLQAEGDIFLNEWEINYFWKEMCSGY